MRVLVIDDTAAIRKALRVMLEDVGHEVLEAGDGRQGIQAYRRVGADVIFCDLFMRGTDGLEVIRELRRDYPNVKLIAMSGGGFQRTLDLLPVARFLGASAVVPKPFDQKTALTAITHVSQARVPG
jgi:CheY-like chemotaxis protein